METTIIVNGNYVTIPQPFTLKELAQRQGLPDAGVAVAVNNRMIPRAQWEETKLKKDDSLVIIGAAYGG